MHLIQKKIPAVLLSSPCLLAVLKISGCQETINEEEPCPVVDNKNKFSVALRWQVTGGLHRTVP